MPRLDPFSQDDNPRIGHRGQPLRPSWRVNSCKRQSHGATPAQHPMPQILPHRSANTLARSVLSARSSWQRVSSGDRMLGCLLYVTCASEFIEQPELQPRACSTTGIDCRMVTSSVETSSFAGDSADQDVYELSLGTGSNSPTPRAGSSELPRRHFAALDSRARPARLRRLQRQHSREEGNGVRDVDEMPLVLQQNSLQMEWCLERHRAPGTCRLSGRVLRFSRSAYRPAVPQEELGPQLVKTSSRPRSPAHVPSIRRARRPYNILTHLAGRGSTAPAGGDGEASNRWPKRRNSRNS